jgi:hypothetical protein
LANLLRFIAFRVSYPSCCFFQFAENLHDNYQKHDVEQDPSEPLEVAAEYVNDKYTSPELVKIFSKICTNILLM